jgi:hypothetical protein
MDDSMAQFLYQKLSLFFTKIYIIYLRKHSLVGWSYSRERYMLY